jgi:hypothetical protein
LFFFARSQLGQPEIKYFCGPILGQEDVGRLDVAMNNAPGMSRLKSGADLNGNI